AVQGSNQTRFSWRTSSTFALAHAPHRALRNRTVEAWEAAGRPPTGERPGEGEVIGRSASIGPILRYQSYTPAAEAQGDIEALSLWAGQSVGLVGRSCSRLATLCARLPRRPKA